MNFNIYNIKKKYYKKKKKRIKIKNNLNSYIYILNIYIHIIYQFIKYYKRLLGLKRMNMIYIRFVVVFM